MPRSNAGERMMLGKRQTRFVGWMLTALGLYLLESASVLAERLPIKAYTTADGLAQNTINRIVRDSRGFLWFCTDEGLSRFDGYTFTTYTTADGLPHPMVKSFLETSSGVYWVGTYYGVCRFNPNGRPQSAVGGPSPGLNRVNRRPPDNGRRLSDDPMFVLYHPKDDSKTGTANALLEDSAGAIWVGAGRGLYRLEQEGADWTLHSVDIGLSREVENDVIVRTLVEDRQGALWIGAGSGLYRRRPDGATERYTTRHGLPANDVLALLVDTNGQLWAGTREGLSQIALEPGTYQPTIIRVYTQRNGFPSPNTRTLFQSSTGQLWVGLITALVELTPQASGEGSQPGGYVSAPVLSNWFVQTLAEDRDGNIWIGTDNGALKLARNGFTTYTETDGLGESRISSLCESRAGDLVGMTIFSSGTPLSWFDGRRFRAIRPRLPQGHTYFGWGWNQLTLQDQAGEWWLPTGQGLVRYPKLGHVRQLATTAPKAIYTIRDGLVSNDVFRLYEDSRGDIWIATFSEGSLGLSRWERATETFHHFGEADGLPSRAIPHAFIEDRVGNLWIGFVDTDMLARFRDGRFTLFTSEHGLPDGPIYDLHVDHAGRLWIATMGGLVRLDDPSAERPQFVTYTTGQGLSSNSINCITEDRYGRLYVGTGRGLDRLDPATDRVKPFSTSDGLISGEVLVSFRDRRGDLWFGGTGGLSRLSPQPDLPQSPPPVLITGLRIGGETHQISALGETMIAPVELGPSKNQIQIDFVALGFRPGEGLRYQYKLEGASEEWSHLADQRTVNFANLAPDRYRFLVRAVNADGVMSDPPASFSFTILPAIWRRWWFVTMVAASVGLAAYALYRYRVSRLVELEHVRTRIASDLHDDVGAGLTRIAVLSEVARHEAGAGSLVTERLSAIARASRELVDSMSDIVWVINPERDHLRDLTQRMRRFASDLFTSRGIEFTFSAPASEHHLKVGADVRRHIFLIFKESVNNIVRHSRCEKADIDLRIDGGLIVLTVQDDGPGFDQADAGDGNGLANMRERARLLGGNLHVSSGNGHGTKIILSAPIKATVRGRNGRLDGPSRT